jgi:hypothetical protein
VNDQPQSDRKPEDAAAPPADTVEQDRRRLLKVAGAVALAGPVMQTLTGKDLLTRSAQAQSVNGQGMDGPMSGTIGFIVA